MNDKVEVHQLSCACCNKKYAPVLTNIQELLLVSFHILVCIIQTIYTSLIHMYLINMLEHVIMSKKVIAHEVVTIRVARGGEYAPLVIPLPKPIAEVMKYVKGDQVRIYTDGERIYIEKLEDPEI